MGNISEEHFEDIRQSVGRAGRGKDGKGEWRESKLCDMSDNWVKNSIKYVNSSAEDQSDHIVFYEMELEYRKKQGISIPDEEPLKIPHGTMKKLKF
jgi:hypothetical protein